MNIPNADTIASYNAYYRFTGDELRMVQDVCARVDGDDALRAAAQSAYTRLFDAQERFSTVNADIRDNLDQMFFVVLCMMHMPKAIAFYRSRGLSLDILRDTLNNVTSRLRKYTGLNGRPSVEDGVWLIMCVKGDVIRLGRLEFEENTYSGAATVFVNQSGVPLKLMNADVPIRSDGRVCGYGISGAETPAFITTFNEKGGAYVGHPVDDHARVSSRTAILDAREYTAALKTGDNVLGVHIPATGPLTKDACDASYALALKLWPERINPGFRFAFFQCESWLMSLNIPEFLDDSFNIYHFNQSFAKLPIAAPPGSHATCHYVFGVRTPGEITTCSKTRLEMRVRDYFAARHDVVDGLGIKNIH